MHLNNKKYDNYKDSGIEWIGKIPQDWSTVVLKRVFSSRDGGAWGEDAKNNDNDRICIRIADFDYPKMTVKHDIEYTVRNYSSDIINKLTLKKNDILIEKSGGGEQTPVGRTIIFNENFDAIYANFMDRLRVRGSNSPKFIQYLLVSFYQNGITYQYIKQTTGIQNLDLTNLLSKEYIALPNKNQQQAIADYLDKKCGEIDNSIETEKEIIEKLKEYKQSVITETVTKGLDKSVEFKGSVIEWIGKIPKHWRVCKIKHKFYLSFDENTDKNATLLSLFTHIGVRPRTEMEDKGNKAQTVIGYSLVKKGDIIVNKLLAWMGAIGISNYDGATSPEYDIYRLKDLSENIPMYYHYLFRSYNFKDECYKFGRGIMLMRLRTYPEQFLNIFIPNISKDEQQQIAEYLDKKCYQIDETIKKKEELIEKLTEYKKSLIYECVTGKRRIDNV